jgi:hypothetical protein
MKRNVLILISALFLAASAPSASAFDDGSFEAVAADVIVVRPFSFVATLIGSALFVVSLPVAAISDSVADTSEALVLNPGRMTFTRPLGELSTIVD